eukprot:scaffold7595_cov267-Pinguiococcus_pyrenoidosus.AAC.16
MLCFRASWLRGVEPMDATGPNAAANERGQRRSPYRSRSLGTRHGAADEAPQAQSVELPGTAQACFPAATRSSQSRRWVSMFPGKLGHLNHNRQTTICAQFGRLSLFLDDAQSPLTYNESFLS